MALEQIAGKTANEIDERFGSANFVKRSARKVFPDHWSFMLGEIALYSFIILLLTGIFLTLWFKPSHDGGRLRRLLRPAARRARCPRPTRRRCDISFDVRGGLIIRQIHHWAALIFVAAMVVHMCRVFFTGAFRKPRETNWIIGVHPADAQLHRGAGRLLAARRPALRHRAADHRGRAALAAGRRDVPVVLPLRRRVPRRGHHPAALHRPRPADPRHLPGADHRAPDAGLVPEAHAVPAARAGPRRTPSATRSSRSTRPRPAASSSSSSA